MKDETNLIPTNVQLSCNSTVRVVPGPFLAGGGGGGEDVLWHFYLAGMHKQGNFFSRLRGSSSEICLRFVFPKRFCASKIVNN